MFGNFLKGKGVKKGAAIAAKKIAPVMKEVGKKLSKPKIIKKPKY